MARAVQPCSHVSGFTDMKFGSDSFIFLPSYTLQVKTKQIPYSLIYRTHVDNFTKYESMFKIVSLLDSARNLIQNDHCMKARLRHCCTALWNCNEKSAMPGISFAFLSKSSIISQQRELGGNRHTIWCTSLVFMVLQLRLRAEESEVSLFICGVDRTNLKFAFMLSDR